MATGYTGTVILISSDPNGVIPSAYTFTGTDAGVRSFAVVLDTAGTQSITATDASTASLAGSELGIAVQSGAAKTLTIAGSPAVDTAGVANDVTVTTHMTLMATLRPVTRALSPCRAAIRARFCRPLTHFSPAMQDLIASPSPAFDTAGIAGDRRDRHFNGDHLRL